MRHNSMKSLAGILVTITLLAIVAGAQTTVTDPVSDPVTDLDVWRLWMTINCPQPADTPGQANLREHLVRKLHVSRETEASSIVSRFCKTWIKAIDDFNQEQATLPIAGRITNQQDFMAWRDKLVAAYVHEMTSLSPERDWRDFLDAEREHVFRQEHGGMPMASMSPRLVNAQWENGNLGSTSSWGYYAYASYAWDGYQLEVVGLVDGSTPIQNMCEYDAYNGMWYPQPYCPGSVYHTPYITLTLTGGAPSPYNSTRTMIGGGVAPDQYLSYSQALISPGWNAYGPSMGSGTMQVAIVVNCNVAGNIVAWQAPKVQWKIVYTRGLVLAADPRACEPMANWCTPATSPPLMSLTTRKPLILAIDPLCVEYHTWWEVYDIAANGGQGWMVMGNGYTWSKGYSAESPPQGACTK